MKRTVMACSLLLAVAISAVTAASDSQRTRTVPRDIRGVLAGTFTFEMFGYGELDFIADGDATGTLSHLGLAKMYTRHQPNPIGDGTLIDTAFKIVAANGDEIWGTYADGKVTLAGAVATELPFYYYYNGKATLVISGGTGRFAHASGVINATFFETIKVLDPYWSEYDCSVAWALEGKVKY
jgi:hypothetical protein